MPFAMLRQRADDGELHPRTHMVWGPGLKDWIPAGEVDRLFDRIPPPESIPAASPVPSETSDSRVEATAVPRDTGSASVASWLALPVAFVLAVIGWAAFWLLHDLVWSFLPEEADGFKVPWVVMLLVFGGAGYLMGKPLGWVLRKTSVGYNASLSLGIVLLAAIVGEVAYTVGWLLLSDIEPLPENVVQALVLPFLGQDAPTVLAGVFHTLLRSLVAIGAWAAILRDQNTDHPEPVA